MAKNPKRSSHQGTKAQGTEKTAPDQPLGVEHQDKRPAAVADDDRIDPNKRFEQLSNAAQGGPNQTLARRTIEISPPSDTTPADDAANDEDPNTAGSPQEAVRTQTIVAALVALIGIFREETRSQKVLLVSNIALFFTVLLSPLAGQISSALKLYSWLALPHPGSEVFLLWMVGIVLMLYGLWSSMPNQREGAEGMAGLRAKQAVEMLAARDMEKAIQKLKAAALEEYERLKAVNAWPFWVASVAFILCIVIEFFALLFLI